MGWGHESERVVRVAIRRSRRTWRTFRIPLEFQQKAWMWLFCQIRQVSEFCTGNELKNPCVWCSAVAYWCGAVAPRAIAALLGRFLPRLGPLVIQAALFSFGSDSCPVIPGREANRNLEVTGQALRAAPK